MKTMKIMTNGQCALINQLKNELLSCAEFGELSFKPHSSRSVNDCTYGGQKTDNAHNLQAKRSMWNASVPLLYCLRCRLMPLTCNKKWSMGLFYFHTSLNSGGFSGMVNWRLPKAGVLGCTPWRGPGKCHAC